MGTILSLCLSILVSLGMSQYLTKQQKDEIDKVTKSIKQKGASYGDLLNAINVIKKHSDAIPQDKLNKLSSLVNNLYTTIPSASGIPEQARAEAKKAIEQIQFKISKLMGEANDHDNNSRDASNAYAALSDDEKNRSKKKGIDYDNARDAHWQNKYRGDPRKQKQAYKEFDQSSEASKYYVWDPQTIGGALAIKAEDEARAAEQKRKEANELGEKYV